VPSSAAATQPAGDVPPVAFYAVADHRHFIGLVAMLNSLRLVGHTEPVFLVDAGLTASQRERLAEHVTLLAAPSGMPPVYMAPLGPQARPAQVAVIVDADIIVLRPLTELVDSARQGRLVAFVNIPPNDDRFFPEWASALDLGEMRRRPYVNAGLFVLPRALCDRLIAPWLARQEMISYGSTIYGAARMTDPFFFADQDVVNALFSAELSDDEIECREYRWAPQTPMRDVSVVDEHRLLCEYPDGSRPFLLHHTMAKPWLRPTPWNTYSRLLPRLLLAPDLTLRLSPDELPRRLRPGLSGSAARLTASGWARARNGARRQLGRFGVRTRIAAWRARRAQPAGPVSTRP
jgi:hypothetical protein